MAWNPDATFISPSTLADFAKCPQLYFTRNIYRTPRGLKVQLINPHLAMGQCIHDTLDQYLKSDPTERSIDNLIEMFNSNWIHFKGDKGGFANSAEESEYYKRAVNMLDRFKINDHFKTAVFYKIPSFPKLDLAHNLILTGKLDWLEKTPDGYHIVDFKTGKNQEKEDSLQLPIYALLVKGLVNSDKIKASFWYLDKDSEITDFSLPDLDLVAADVANQGTVIQLAKQTNSFRCQSGADSCWACKDMLAIAQNKGKLVTIDPARKQEIYILPKTNSEVVGNDLPF